MGLDRIKQSVPVVGTGPVQLTANAAPGGYQTFGNAMSAGSSAAIAIVDQVTYDWEVTNATYGPPTLVAPGGSLTRTTTLSSSYNNAPVNFMGNNCDVFTVGTAATAISSSTIAAFLATLPTTQPSAGGLWLNGGVVCYTPGTGPANPDTAAMVAFFASLPSTRPAGGGAWLDGGVVVVS